MAMRMRAIANHAAFPWFPLYYLLIVGGGILLLGWNIPNLSGVSWTLVLVWLAMVLSTDAAPVSLPGGGYITISSTLDFAGIMVLGPAVMGLIEFVATVLLQGGVQRRPKHRVLFNAAAFAGTVLIAGWVFRALGGVPGQPLVFPGILLPMLGMGVTYYLLNTAAVTLILSLSDGRKPWQVWQVNYRWTMFHLTASVPLGAALVVAHQSLGLWGCLLFVVPLLLARYTLKLYMDTKQDLLDFAGVLAGVIDEFDPYTCQHSKRVSRDSALLAREMGMSERGVEQAEYSGLLHDIGKISVSQRDLIVKAGPLTPEEKLRISLHADIGADILCRVRGFRKLAPVVRYHHERMDGHGYHNLPVADIPKIAKVVMVADAFDAMTSDRVYRKAMSLEDALEELDRHSGTQFDPSVVAALNRLVLRGEIKIDEESQQYEPKKMPQASLVNAGL